MVRISGDVVIDSSVEEVFDFVADERNEPKYNSRIVSAEKLSEGPVGEGSRFVAEPRAWATTGCPSRSLTMTDRSGFATVCARPTCRLTAR